MPTAASPSFLALCACLLLLGAAAPAEEVFYIGASGPVGNGSGTSAGDAADASTAERYGALVRGHAAAGTTIVYAAGTYLTYGATEMHAGVVHRGAGMDATVIKLADGTATGWRPVFLAPGAAISGFRIEDLTIDMNADHQPWWKANAGSSLGLAFSTADHCAIQRVKFIRMGARKQESFPVFFTHGNSADGLVHHNLVDSCVFTQPITTGNTDGLTCVMLSDAHPRIAVDNTNVVSNCRFLDLRSPGCSDLAYAQCITGPVARGNFARGVDALWFIEPGSQPMGDNRCFIDQTVEVSGNTLVDSGPVARIYLHPNGAFGNLQITGNTIGMAENPYSGIGNRGPVAIEFTVWNQDGDPGIGTVAVHGNVLIAPAPRVLPPLAVKAVLGTGPGVRLHLAGLEFNGNVLLDFPGDGSEFRIAPEVLAAERISHSGNLSAGAGARVPAR